MISARLWFKAGIVKQKPINLHKFSMLRHTNTHILYSNCFESNPLSDDER